MPTFLFDAHVFGPIKSRRLGSSLGINLLSVNQKVCNFNCVYCECGLTTKLQKEESVYADKVDLLRDLKEKFSSCLENKIPIDAITFAGNGEPTMHPQFLSIVKDITRLRNRFFPNAKIAVLTNGYTMDRARVREALLLVDKAIVKMDAGDDDYLQLIDRPKGGFSMDSLMKNLETFDGDLIIQTMFLKGTIKNKEFDNSKGPQLDQWIDRIKTLAPSEVMLYSLDRDTPLQSLQAISKMELETIAKRLNEINITTQVV